MSIGQVTITYTAKKTVNNTLVPVVIGSSTLVTGTGATKSVAEASAPNSASDSGDDA